MLSLNLYRNHYLLTRERFGSVTDRSFEISQQQQQQKSETKETEMANFSWKEEEEEDWESTNEWISI